MRSISTRISAHRRVFVIYCQFCNNHGHTLNNCRNPELQEMDIRFHLEKEKIINDNNIHFTHHKSQLFFKIKEIVEPYGDYNKTRAYAILKCRYRSLPNSDTINDVIHCITNYIYDNDFSIQQDFIPFNDDDATQYLMEDNQVTIANSNLKQSSHIDILLCKEIPSNLLECPICYENKEIIENVSLDCNHSFCKECMLNIFKMHKTNQELSCALCRHEIKMFKVFDDNVMQQLRKYL